jgi:hypothetical protein
MKGPESAAYLWIQIAPIKFKKESRAAQLFDVFIFKNAIHVST